MDVLLCEIQMWGNVWSMEPSPGHWANILLIEVNHYGFKASKDVYVLILM